MNERVMVESQDDYCRGCILVPGCNVVLKEGESCGDKLERTKWAVKTGGHFKSMPKEEVNQ